MPQTLTREAVVKIASAQRFMLWTILIAILVNIATQVVRINLEQQAAAGQLDPSMLLMFGLTILVISIGLIALQIFSVVRLCLALEEGWATVIYAVLQIAPCLSLILLLFLNGRATARLKTAGIRVGLMGARKRDIDNYQSDSRQCSDCGEEISAQTAVCPLCGAQQATVDG